MRDRTRRLLGLGLLGHAAFGYYVKSKPLPVEDVDVAEGLDARLWSFVTPDGLTLRGKRYAVPGGQPIVLAHGFTGNGLEFDIPKKGYNLAAYLARRGFDVYLYSIRGCGREPYVADAGDWLHTMDHFAALDVPTLVEGITRETGKKPAWLGHSMGGMILYMYLQGATFDREMRFSADAALAAERNNTIAAGVTLASPVCFGWPAGAPYARVMESSVVEFATARAVKFLRGLPANRQKIPAMRYLAMVADMFPRLSSVFARNPAMFIFYNPRNVDGEVVTLMARTILDNLSVRMTVQLFEDILAGNAMDYERTYNYTDNMDRVTAPLLFITGSKDFVTASEVERCGFEKVSSQVKDIRCFEGFGHTDLVMGLNVENTVYPYVAEWLERVTGTAH